MVNVNHLAQLRLSMVVEKLANAPVINLQICKGYPASLTTLSARVADSSPSARFFQRWRPFNMRNGFGQDISFRGAISVISQIITIFWRPADLLTSGSAFKLSTNDATKTLTKLGAIL